MSKASNATLELSEKGPELRGLEVCGCPSTSRPRHCVRQRQRYRLGATLGMTCGERYAGMTTLAKTF